MIFIYVSPKSSPKAALHCSDDQDTQGLAQEQHHDTFYCSFMITRFCSLACGMAMGLPPSGTRYEVSMRRLACWA